jgi:hypothetical protein
MIIMQEANGIDLMALLIVHKTMRDLPDWKKIWDFDCE